MRRRRRSLAAVIVAAAALVVGAVFVTRGDDAPDGSPSDAASSGATRGEPAALLALAVTGGDVPVAAVVGAGEDRPAAALVLPSEMTVVVPGQGEVLMGAAAGLPADSMHVAVSNVVGTWTERYASMDLEEVAALVDDAGRITVDVPEATTIAGVLLGPGDTEMNGRQAAGYLGAPSDETTRRWEAVLQGLLAAAPSLDGVELETDDAEGAAAIWAAAADASVETAPTEVLTDTVMVPLQPELDDLVGSLFGTAAPIPALVQNGSGTPGIGEDVATLIIPEGFRVVLSTNAESFDHEMTEVVALGAEHRRDARRVHGLLGVGVVHVTQVPSGLADVTIVVGKDFAA